MMKVMHRITRCEIERRLANGRRRDDDESVVIPSNDFATGAW
jgi:hypothetical protein